MLNVLKSKRGDSSVFQVIACIGIITFLLFFPVITYSYFKLQNTTDSIGMDIVQVASTRGGVDEQVIELLVEELTANGYDFNGAVIQQEDGNAANSIRVYTNVPVIRTYTLDNGKKIQIDYLDECYDGSTDLTCNSNRRYRTDSDKDSIIKVRIVVPVSAHSRMINNLYTLITVRGDNSAVEYLDEQAGYVVTYSTLSELYNKNTIER